MLVGSKGQTEDIMKEGNKYWSCAVRTKCYE